MAVLNSIAMTQLFSTFFRSMSRILLPMSGILCLLFFMSMVDEKQETKKIVPKKSLSLQFNSAEEVSTFILALKDLAFDLPSDWSDYKYLVLEIKASSPQRFYMGPVPSNGWELPLTIQPFSGAWIRFTIPLAFFSEIPSSAADMSATYNKDRKLGHIILHDKSGTLTGVSSLVFSMYNPLNSPTLEIRSISVSKYDPGESLLEETFLVDRFGQWATEDWDGKVKSIEELQSAWKKEDKQLKTKLFSKNEVSPYGGYKGSKQKATGFFRTEKINGKWWFIDPEGYLFLSVGADCIHAGTITKSKDREFVFEQLKETGDYANFYQWNISQRYSAGHESKWVNTAIQRMYAWGINTVANWSSTELTKSNKVPFVLTLPGLQLGKGIMGLPDVYDPQYAADIDKAISEMAQKQKDNPWLLGYFVGNEQPWPGKESIFCDRILSGSDKPIQKELKTWIKQNGDSPESRRNFVYHTFDKFLEMVNTTLKKHDPNHLNLGMRFSGHTSDEILAITGKHFDVFSFNSYTLQPDVDFINRVDAMTGLPVIIGEYHFGVPLRGMSAGLVQVPTYQERGNAYRYYNEQGYSHPSLIGAHWFQWIDQPNTGRTDGENYNIGLLDITDRPYPEMVKAMQETHKRLYKIHNGDLQPYAVKPAAKIM
jgi:hypothetical protein